MAARACNLLLVLCTAVAGAACGRAQVAPTMSQASPPNPPSPPTAMVAVPVEKTTPFHRTLESQGIRFVVDSPNRAGGNIVRISTEGLADDAVTVDRDIPGPVVAAEVADLDADGAPEVYIHVGASPRSGRAALVAYSANRGTSLRDIYLPPLEDGPGAAIGFVGPEEMAVVDASLLRRFRVEGGKTRQLRYRLHAGDAGWEFRLQRTDEF
ncbi:hypothetical protein [Thermomonas mangrovi]|uniref:hypothetical protein n=1 Tax=Thermomonas mangrovi TaxID=2993316 RepID=UPI002307D38B|nr:hypothetical protein [Thermomonas mangrovi]